MKNLFNKKKIFKYILILIIILYTLSIFINQQKKLNSYGKMSEEYQKQIEEETEYKNTLIAMKENIDSTEYIEQVAREMLDMYLPNERVYIDASK